MAQWKVVTCQAENTWIPGAVRCPRLVPGPLPQAIPCVTYITPKPIALSGGQSSSNRYTGQEFVGGDRSFAKYNIIESKYICSAFIFLVISCVLGYFISMSALGPCSVSGDMPTFSWLDFHTQEGFLFS